MEKSMALLNRASILVPSALGWSTYSTYEETVNYFTAAANGYSPSEISFSAYDVIVLNTPESGGVTQSSENGSLDIRL